MKCAWLGKDATLSGNEDTFRSAGSATKRATQCAGSTFVNWVGNEAGARSAARRNRAYEP